MSSAGGTVVAQAGLYSQPTTWFAHYAKLIFIIYVVWLEELAIGRAQSSEFILLLQGGFPLWQTLGLDRIVRVYVAMLLIEVAICKASRDWSGKIY